MVYGRGAFWTTMKIGTVMTLDEADLALFLSGHLVISDQGKRRYFNDLGQLHKDGGPAIITTDGVRWCQYDKLHREDGPAVVNINGYQAWWRRGIRHRDDGPAIVMSDGREFWYQNGKQVKPI